MEHDHLAHKTKKLNIYTISCASFTLSLLVAAAWIIYAVQHEKRDLQQASQFYSHNISQKISLLFQSLAQNLSPIYTMLVLQDGKTDKFEQLAEDIIKANAEIININLAKDGIVSNVFPYVTNSQALGHNLLQAEDRKREAILAKESRQMTLSGPFDLLQGGTGLAFRQPIFLPRSPGEREKTFWGFCIVTYRFPQILTTRVDFGILSAAGFSWALWRKDPASGERSVLLASGTPLDAAAVRQKAITLQNVTWYLDISPVHGWIDSRKVMLYAATAFSLCLLFSLVVTQFAVLLNKNREISRQARTDSLTNLYNKSSFWELLEPAIERHLKHIYASGDPRLFLCVFDLNDFKKINDDYGHIIGDKVLVEFARRLSDGLSSHDFASRFGGDEFVAVFYCTPNKEWLLPEKLEHIKLRLEEEYEINGNKLHISFGFGAISPQSDMLAEKRGHLTLGEFFVEKVDKAMYSDKRTFHTLGQTDALAPAGGD